MLKTPGSDVENSQTPHGSKGIGPKGTTGHRWETVHHGPWSWGELCVVWDHADWTAREISQELLKGRSPDSIRRIRERYGRFRVGRIPTCAKCGVRPVWVESAHARRLGLCESCYLEEEELRLRDTKRNATLRQRRKRARRRGDAE